MPPTKIRPKSVVTNWTPKGHVRGRFFRQNKSGPAPRAETLSLITRKDQAAMSSDEQQRFLSAINTLIANGFYGKYVAIHADMKHNMHTMDGPIGTQRFLPWHRVFLLDLEREMRSIDPRIFIPYWDWLAVRQIPGWLQNFLPSVDVAGHTVHVTRHPGALSPLPTQNAVDQALAHTDYTSFTSALEQVHNDVHNYVGGTMADISVSPSDPIFWMHHSNIDRLWSTWQPKHPTQHANLSGKNAIMDPWTVTEPQTRDITTLGYSY
jgi:tyrosinase